MNNSVTTLNSTTLSLEEQSINGLKGQLVFTVLIYVVLAFFTLLSNIGILFIMFKGREVFRSNHYKLVIHMSLVSGAQALYVVTISGLYHVFQVILKIPDYGTAKRCAFVLMFLEVSLTVDQINVLSVAVDRFTAVVSPYFYKNLNRSKVYIVSVFCIIYTFSIADASSKMFLYTDQFANTWLPVCVMPNTRTLAYLNYRYIRCILLAAVTVAFYLGALLIVQIKIRSAGNNSQQLKKDLGFLLLVATGVDAIVYTFTYFLGQVYQYIIIPTASAQARTLLGPVGMGFNLLCSTPRFFVFLFLNKDFRKCAKIYILRQQDVTTVTTLFTSRSSISKKGSVRSVISVK